MTAPDEERTRREALAALGPHGDARAREALEGARVGVELDVSRWEATAGTVRGQRVTLGIDAALLAEVRRAPAVRDALHAALAASVARRGGEALVDLRVRWDPLAGGGAGHPYRGGPGPSVRTTLAEALGAFLAAEGEGPLAAAAARSEVTAARERGRVAATVRGEPATVATLERGRRALETALGALLCDEGDALALEIAAR